MSRPDKLIAEQLTAVDPSKNAWVSASAGTGKTQVLTARVLRLLLAGTAPDRILALTFTKAAAAEMQTRIFRTLGRWVRADDAALADELDAIGAPVDRATLNRARSLFAAALEVRGGLSVQTLHSFAGRLLSAFPLEADVAPGYATLDDRDRDRLRDDLLARRASTGDGDFLAILAALSVQSAEDGVRSIIKRLIGDTAFERSYGGGDVWRAAVRRALGLPGMGTHDEILAAALAPDRFDWHALDSYVEALRKWGTQTGAAAAMNLTDLRDMPPRDAVSALRKVARKENNGPRLPQKKGDDHFAALHAAFCDAASPVIDIDTALQLADIAALHLNLGHAMAADYAAAKREAGALDYDDLIVRAARLLEDLRAAYVLYKLDQRIDHILVDEGQDTNAAQWTIVNAIAEEFFAGEGARGAGRTQFAVGDYKQAIFGFQGTNPDEFERARATTEARAKAAGQPFELVQLKRSFRSVPAVLDVVDKVIEEAGNAAFGVHDAIPPHDPHRKKEAGEVVVWPAVSADAAESGDGEDNGDLDDAQRELARRIAGSIAGWIRSNESLAARGRPIRSGDVLILVRSRRKGIVFDLVNALHRAGVPVAGADRLQLTQPIAVKDLLALARFALQPGDDLSLAELLVSPFLRWSQDDLFKLAHGREGSLWRALRDAPEPHARAAREWLSEVLKGADMKAPYEFFEAILSGPLEGRARLLARLGEEARDPIEEVLNQALLFEATNTPSLQGFLQWIDSDDAEVKRDADAPRDAVRIMTVHGAKGLQAPIVILADAAATAVQPVKPPIPLDLPGIGPAPIYFGTKDKLTGEALAAYERCAREAAEEAMRLLYVAMTRAEDRLYVTGCRGKRMGSEPSWYDRIASALQSLGAERFEDAEGGEVLRYARGEPSPPRAVLPTGAEELPAPPAWATSPRPDEEEPPRPLIPSAAGGEDDTAVLPPGPGLLLAARRGQVLHQLFERVGEISPERREAAMHAWVRRNAPDLDPERIAAEVLRVLALPDAADFFGADALAEAPLSAIVERKAITGTIDRLLVTPTRIAALDFKTGLWAPETAGAVPPHHRRQMRAYRDALQAIFPGRAVEVALLYTAVPRLIVLDEGALGDGTE